MIKRMHVQRFDNDRSVALRHPSGKGKRITTWFASINLDDSRWVEGKIAQPGFACGCDLIKIAHACGSHARLWIGNLDGIIAPMDVPPQDWFYPSGIPVEPEFFWQWTPSDTAQTLLEEEIRSENPLTDSPSHLKRLVPCQMERKHGAIAQVNAIDLVRLPDLFRRDVGFLFEADGVDRR